MTMRRTSFVPVTLGRFSVRPIIRSVHIYGSLPGVYAIVVESLLLLALIIPSAQKTTMLSAGLMIS